MTAFHKITRAPKTLDGINCLLFAIGIEQLTSQTLKMYVGRLRPNFYALCGFDTKLFKCTADLAHQTEARLSFPSGHSSLSFCSMGILMWFGLGCWIRICNTGGDGSSYREGTALGHTMRQKFGRIGVLVALSPLLFSTFVAASRLADNWHHPSDIIAGTIIGFSCSTISYHLWWVPS